MGSHPALTRGPWISSTREQGQKRAVGCPKRLGGLGASSLCLRTGNIRGAGCWDGFEKCYVHENHADQDLGNGGMPVYGVGQRRSACKKALPLTRNLPFAHSHMSGHGEGAPETLGSNNKTGTAWRKESAVRETEADCDSADCLHRKGIFADMGGDERGKKRHVGEGMLGMGMVELPPEYYCGGSPYSVWTLDWLMLVKEVPSQRCGETMVMKRMCRRRRRSRGVRQQGTVDRGRGARSGPLLKEADPCGLTHRGVS